MRYTAADGAQKRSVKGLKVASKDRKGKSLPADVYDRNMRAAYRAAQELWNELDESEEPRFLLG